MWHESLRCSIHDKFFVSAGNPKGDGGGLIASTNTREDAQRIQVEAIKHNYTRVRIYTAAEMWGEHANE